MFSLIKHIFNKFTKKGHQEKSTVSAVDLSDSSLSSLLRVGIVGAGHMGFANAQAVNASGIAKVTSVMDKNIEAGKTLASKVAAKYVTDFNDFINLNDIDIVFISVPHDLLATLAIQAAEKGKHLIVEKPVSINIADLNRLNEICSANKVFLTSNYWLRYLPMVQLAKKLINEGAIGEIIGTEVQVHQHKDVGYWIGAKTSSPTDWRALKTRSGGGMLMMTTCHALDYMRYISGLDIVRVYSEYGTLNTKVEVEDTLTMTMRYANDGVGCLSTSSNMRGSRVEEHRIWGRQGTMIFNRDRLSFYSTRRVMGKKPGRWHEFKFRSFSPIDGVAEIVKRFGGAIRGGPIQDVVFDDIYMNLIVMQCAYRSCEEGRPIDISTMIYDDVK